MKKIGLTEVTTKKREEDKLILIMIIMENIEERKIETEEIIT